MKNPHHLALFISLLVASAALAADPANTSSARSTTLSPTTMTQAQTNLPLFYRNLVAFDQDKHGKLDFPDTPPSYAYAAATNVIPLLIHETGLALKSYPLVFIPGADGSPPTLAAMVGIGDGVNRFVEPNGQWRPGAYIPAWVRRYPFLAVTPEGAKNTVLALDPSADMLQQTGGQPLIKDGQPSERLKHIIAFNQEFSAIAERSSAIAQALMQAGVLEEGSLKIQPPGSNEGAATEIKGFLVVSEQKLRALSDEAVLKLHKADAFGLAYAQILSMGNLGNLFAAPINAAPALLQGK